MNSYIDCHNHSLPFIDDGAKDIQMAIDMLRISEQDGVKSIIFTPHHLNGAFSNHKQKIIESFEKFKETAYGEIPNLQLHLGSEVHLIDSSADEILNDLAMTYADNRKAALLELPKHNIPFGTDKVLSQLIYNGITPVIAHPERNTSIRKNNELLHEWVDMGCKSQLTAMSCEGKFGSEIQETSFEMISKGLVHLIASDAHRPTGRSPKLSSAAVVITEQFNSEVADTLFFNNPKKLITGESLSNLDPIHTIRKTKRKRFLWF